ncbi:uncharacterized protein EHS24_004322 [Apiotrichum porosum]|uniref:CCD97-like C-terminal domain-containing protein n=1 Tax=Apiotrichum porosum TaxID=105984 RepID=A0A427Y4T7_9TREE|nr:uncharacterized protein EHS24_004322 [Apiotrichum porosum]RSH86100.1 hypothetical protein EHS24_004322 [Apiotrichum porosum]
MAVPQHTLEAVQTHLGLDTLPPANPLTLLSLHLDALPPSLARDVGGGVSPKDRAKVPGIKARRVLYGTSGPTTAPSSSTLPAAAAAGAPPRPRPPLTLTAEAGRVRWPLLWERLGGDPRVTAATTSQRDESDWASTGFMPGQERFVGRLGRMLAEEEEVREWEQARGARMRERRMDDVGEEFEDSDDDDDVDMGVVPRVVTGPNGTPIPVSAGIGAEDQDAVVEMFERQLLELFIDGLDTLDYDDIDFAEPLAEDPIAARDAQDAWFDDEPPSASAAVRNGGATGNGAGHGVHAMENGQGEYDY